MVANTLKLVRNGAVGFIDWLDVARCLIENTLVPELLGVCEPRPIRIGQKLSKLIGVCDVITLKQRNKISKRLLRRLGGEIKHDGIRGTANSSHSIDALGKAEERVFICRRVKLNVLTSELRHLHLTRIVPKIWHLKANFIGLSRLEGSDWGFMPPILPAPTPVSKPKLLDQVRDAIRLRHYSIRTEQVYINWIKRFILFHNKRHPTEMAEAEVRKFLSYLARIGNVAASTQNQALSALLFLYKEVLRQEIGWLGDVERAKRPPKLPVVLSRTEIRKIFLRLTGTEKLMAGLLYGGGLRLMECMRLRVKDIDFDYAQITVRDGKGGKDRVTMLPVNLAAPLQKHVARMKMQHDQDLIDGFGAVHLPFALARKFPNAEREWAWQYIFSFRPLERRSAIRQETTAPHVGSDPAKRAENGRAGSGHRKAGDVSHVATLLRDAFAGARLRHSHRAGIVRP